MVVKREYICDFCNNTHFDDAGLYGALWVGKELSLLHCNKSERHLCETCIAAISKAHIKLNVHPESEVSDVEKR
jgi:hypothetical protein